MAAETKNTRREAGVVMNATPYVPRHAAPAPGGIDWSRAERARVDGVRADSAVLVLAATDDSPESRLLYRELLLSGALTPTMWAVAS